MSQFNRDTHLERQGEAISRVIRSIGIVQTLDLFREALELEAADVLSLGRTGDADNIVRVADRIESATLYAEEKGL